MSSRQASATVSNMGFYSETIFPWMLDKGLRGPDIDRLTQEMLQDVHGDVLEIGFGSARTLPHYPSTAISGLWAIEPSQGMTRRSLQRIAASSFPVHFEPGVGEKLPFADARFDCVSLAFTLCSVQQPAAVMAEIKRVLKPQGTLHLLEHVASEDAAWHRWQHRLEPLQKIIGCGCHLTRDPQALVEKAGGRFLRQRREIVADLPAFPKLFPLVCGTAQFCA